METIVETLCSNMISDKEQLRDISSIGKNICILALELDSCLMKRGNPVCLVSRALE